jgi:hypothetical protein
MQILLLVAGTTALCFGCATREHKEPDLRLKLERQFRGVWQSRKFASKYPEFASCTNLTIYIYRVGRHNPYVLAEVVGAFVYKTKTGDEIHSYPVELTYDDRIHVGPFMGAIAPRYRFKSGLLVLEKEEGP